MIVACACLFQYFWMERSSLFLNHPFIFKLLFVIHFWWILWLINQFNSIAICMANMASHYIIFKTSKVLNIFSLNKEYLDNSLSGICYSFTIQIRDLFTFWKYSRLFYACNKLVKIKNKLLFTDTKFNFDILLNDLA